MSGDHSQDRTFRSPVAWPLIVLLVLVVSASSFLGWKLLKDGEERTPTTAMRTATPTYAPTTQAPSVAMVTIVCATGIGAGGAATVAAHETPATAPMSAEVASCPLLRGTDGSRMRAGWSQEQEAVVFRNEKGFSYYDADTPEIFQGVVGRMIAGSA